MSKSFPLEQIPKTSNFDSILILRQYKLDLIASSMENKSINPKFKKDQKAKPFGWSSSTLQRYRNDINMLASYKSPSNSNQRNQKTSSQLKRPQMTSKNPIS